MRNSNLGLDDLVSRRKTGPETSKLMNVKVPTRLLERIGAVAEHLGAQKTEVVCESAWGPTADRRRKMTPAEHN